MVDPEARVRALEKFSQAYRVQMRGDMERAIELYTESIAIFPTAEAFTFRGWAYSAMGRLDDAISECRRAIETDPTFGNPYNDIGAYLIEKGEGDEAIDWLEQAKLAPRYEPRHFPYMNLGRLYASRGMVRRAIEEFEAAFKIAPNDPACTRALAALRSSLN